ncbi:MULTISPECIES: sensor histidine kinase [Chitinophagaceae]
MKYKATQRTLLMHVFFFFFFLVIPALVFERLPEETLFSVTNMIVQDTIANMFLLCFFYLNYYFFLPKFFFEKKYIRYVFYVMLFLGVTFPLPHLIAHWVNFGDGHRPPPDFRPYGTHFPPPDQQLSRKMAGDHGHRPTQDHFQAFSFSFNEFRRHLYLFFTAFFFSFLLKTREHLSELKEDKLNAELRSLKAQINPHFLFNTLNTIYALSIKKEDRASDAIVHLSGLMRYVTKDINEQTIPLQKEIDYITNYIELQKARLGNTVKIWYDTFGEGDNKRIIPLILITYIENAFKYGVNPDVPNCIVKIKICITDTGIVLLTFNKKVPNLNSTESTGIGMMNTNERLKHLYPKKHTLEIVETENHYSVTLSIELI